MKWTNEEITILENNQEKSLADIAAMLPGRTVDMVKLKRLKLGLLKKHNPVHWTEEEIKILKNYGANSYSHDLLKMLPNHTAEGIAHKLKRLKIYKTSDFMKVHGRKYCGRPDRKITPRYNLDQNLTIDELDNPTFQVLIGSLLGDGGITNQNRNQRYLFKEDHCVEQADYVIWKHKMFKTFEPSKPSCLSTKPIFSTPSHPIFGLLRREFYNEEEERKAYIPLHYIERLDELGLLVWYLDDGCKNNWCPSITSTLFTPNNLTDVINILNKKLNLALYIRTEKELCHGKPHSTICFRATERNKIMPIWENLFQEYDIPECMKYKITKP